MKLNYNVSGGRRKELVEAAGAFIGWKPVYKGAPSFAYAVGNYLIDKTGMVTGADNIALEAALHQQGFDAETREYDEPDTYESGLGGMGAADLPDIDQDHPGQYADPNESPAGEMLDCSSLGMTEEEELGLGRERRENYQGENGMQASDVPESADAGAPEHLTVEYPLAGLSSETLDNLTKMVTAKEALIKAALGVEELPIQITEETVNFPWFTLDDPSHAAYYVQFVWALCKTAKEKKRVTAKKRGLTGNPKYAFRCWLLSLGLIGDECKNARKLLLARLDGNSAYLSGSRPAYTAHCYTYPNGSEEDAMDATSEEFTSLAKAKARVDAFAADTPGIYFAGAHVEDEKGGYVYELLCG